MGFDEAKTRLNELRGQITNHNTNIKKYTEKKTEVLKILGEINSLIEKIKSTVGENSEAKKNLDELIRLVTDIPQIDQELKDNELVDLLGILQGVKNKLEDIVGGPPTGGSPEGTRSGNFIRRGDGLVSANSQEGGRKRGGFKFTSNAIKSRKSRYMTRKRKSKSPKRRQKTRKTPKRRKRTRRKRRKGRKRRRKSQRKRRR